MGSRNPLGGSAEARPGQTHSSVIRDPLPPPPSFPFLSGREEGKERARIGERGCQAPDNSASLPDLPSWEALLLT